jgi:hypothetical protein
VKRQHVIGGLLALFVVAIVAWIATNSYWEEYDWHSGLQGEALTNPFYAAQRLAGELGAHTRLRHELVAVPPPNAIIVVGSWNWNIIPERRERLERWVSDGGRLVASQSLLADQKFDEWAGVTRTPSKDKDKVVKKFPCLPGVECAAPETPSAQEPDKANRRWTICDLSEFNYLSTSRKVSWRLTDMHSRAQVLRIPIGRGSVTILNADPFREDALTCGDDARLFVSATQLRPGDHIEFLTEESGASLLDLIWKYGAPVVLLSAALIALWLWRSGVRFGPLMAEPDLARRSLAEQIRGTGKFTLRFGGGRALHAAVTRALDETAAHQVPHYGRLSGDERLATLAPLTGLNAHDLAAALDSNVARHPHELRKAIATLELARRHMIRIDK